MKTTQTQTPAAVERQRIASEIWRRVRQTAAFFAAYLLLITLMVCLITTGEISASALLHTVSNQLALWALATVPLIIVVWGRQQSAELSRLFNKGSAQVASKTTAAATTNDPDQLLPESLPDEAVDDEQTFDLHLLLKLCAKSFRPLTERKGIKMNTCIHKNVARMVTGSQSQLGCVLTSLLDNAVKYTECGEIALSVKTLEQSHGYILMRFEVIDTGIGIHRDQQNRLFEMNQTVSDDGQPSLVDVKTIVEGLGGGIGVSSELHHGSTFWFTAILRKKQTDDSDVVHYLHGSLA